MTVVAAVLVPGTPLPLLKPENLPWGRLATACQRAGRAVAAARPETLLVYSTQWMAVLDQLWQTRPRVTGLHVDENWHEYGEMRFDMQIDTELAYACVAESGRIGVQSKAVNYDAFPIDSGTIAANAFLNPDGRFRLLIGSNNLYHDWDTTEKLGALAARVAASQDRKVAVVGIGGLSGAMFREPVDIREDRISRDGDDKANRRLLDLIERADIAGIRSYLPEYAETAAPDMGMKHLAWILGALDGRFFGARTHGYGPAYGAGAAVVEFRL
ncbi:MAG: tRNA U-34 5-methylaminomethyl-2-thiouridine biosynthesis protein [Sneathiellaceae bacterium]